MPYIIEAMDFDDIPAVVAIERQCFPLPWPVSAYRRELRTPNTNRYVVARWVEESRMGGKAAEQQANRQRLNPVPERNLLSRIFPFLAKESDGLRPASPYPIVGYAGLWLMVDEAHVTTIAAAPAHQGRGVGELLFQAMIEQALEMNATWLTLEVRVSNVTAQNLYRKYGLKEAGRRRRYYTDNGEDAYIMWSEPLRSKEFQDRYQQLKTELRERVANKSREKGTPPVMPRPAPLTEAEMAE